MKSPYLRVLEKIKGLHATCKAAEQMIRSIIREIETLPHIDNFPKCNGRGWIKLDNPPMLITCPKCQGLGVVERPKQKPTKNLNNENL